MISEEQAFQDMPAIDQLRAPSPRVGAEQAAANRKQNARDLLSIVPGPGNVIAAEDAVEAFGDAGRYRAEGKGGKAMGSAALGMLSAFGAVTGFPTSRLAGNAARGASSRTNIFAGPMAKTADHAALAKAQEMKAAGASRDDIHLETGWDLGNRDGVPRFEIDDSAARLSGVEGAPLREGYIPVPENANRFTFSGIEHPELSAAYADRPPIGGQYGPGVTQGGRYASGEDAYIVAKGPNTQSAKGVTLHELQHDVQAREGFAEGASPGQMAAQPNRLVVPKEVQSKIDWIDGRLKVMNPLHSEWAPLRRQRQALIDKMANDQYMRSAGEVEARNVQTRMNMTAAERRVKAPWLTQDVPDDQQIIRRR